MSGSDRIREKQGTETAFGSLHAVLAVVLCYVDQAGLWLPSAGAKDFCF